ncbi:MULTISPECIES: ASCH domain-containing protein [Microbacterium]
MTFPRVGSHWIACDGRGVPRIIIRTVELRLGPFASADAAFAADEGEDDLSLANWQREHRRYWTRVAQAQGREWSEDEEIVFERFQVVWPPQHTS